MIRARSQTPVRIAVLPLDVGGDTADEYLAEGVSDAIRSQLASDSRLEVIGRASSDAYQHSEKSVDSIAAELRVTYVATGRLSRSDSSVNASLRLELELRQPESGGRVFSKLLTVPVRDLGSASDSLANLVASLLGTRSTPSLMAARGITADSRARAYDAFLRGEMITDHDGTWEAARLQKAIPYFAEALREDSLFVPAWAAMARAEAALFNSSPTLSTSSAAHRALLRSQTLAPTWPGSLLAASVVAHTIDNDNQLALASAKGGLAYAPHDADLLIAAADGERSFGRWQAAFSLYHEAVNVDPRSPRASMKLIEWYIWQRDYRKALAEANRGLAFAPKNLDLRLHKVMTQVDMGDLAAARTTIAEAPTGVDRARMAGFFVNFYDMGWVLDDSLKAVLLNAQTSQKDSATDWSMLANLAMMRGDTVQARAFALRMVKIDAAEAAEFPSNAQSLLYLCFDLAFAGETDTAIRACRKAIIEERRFGGAYQEGASLYYLARVATIGGRNEVAIAALDTALSIPSNVSRDAIRINPNFASLRTNAKFRALIANH